MKAIFKPKDKVFDYQFGWGEVVRIKDDGSVYVEFSNRYYCVYGSSGKFTLLILTQLSHSPNTH